MTTESHLGQGSPAVNDSTSASNTTKPHDDDSIEFSSDISVDNIVSFDKNNPTEEKDPYEDEDLQAPVSHRAESTLLNDSPLLKLIEEVEGERPKRKTPHGLIISCIFVAIVALVVGAIALIGLHSEKSASVNEPAKGQTVDVVVPELERTWHSYEISPPDVNVLINGVAMKTMEFPPEHDEASGLPLVIQKTNMVSFFREGYVPFSDTIAYDRDFEESPLHYEMMDADIYQHSTLTIKPPKNVKPGEAIIYINGQGYGTEEDIEISCVSGFPYFIHVQQNGFGDHLHVVWPIRNKQEVQLPVMQLQNNANVRTALSISIRNEYLKDNSFTLDVLAEGQHTTKPGLRHIAKGELIEIKLRKDGRYPLDLILDSTPFGSITVDPYMQLASLGAATLKFDRKSMKDITVCFRRASEAVCATPDEENILPSGRWEMVAYRLEGDKKIWFENAPYEELEPDTEYTLMIKPGTGFDYSLTAKKSKKKNR